MPFEPPQPPRAPAQRYVPLLALSGARSRTRWGGLKFRPSHSVFGTKLRSSIWVRNMRSRSKRVFLCC